MKTRDIKRPKTSQMRHLKLQPEQRTNKYGKQTTVPSLKLSGQWLAKLGFEPGMAVKVTTRERLLVIEPAENPVQGAMDYIKLLQELKDVLNRA